MLMPGISMAPGRANSNLYNGALAVLRPSQQAGIRVANPGAPGQAVR